MGVDAIPKPVILSYSTFNVLFKLVLQIAYQSCVLIISYHEVSNFLNTSVPCYIEWWVMVTTDFS